MMVKAGVHRGLAVMFLAGAPMMLQKYSLQLQPRIILEPVDAFLSFPTLLQAIYPATKKVILPLFALVKLTLRGGGSLSLDIEFWSGGNEHGEKIITLSVPQLPFPYGIQETSTF